MLQHQQKPGGNTASGVKDCREDGAFSSVKDEGIVHMSLNYFEEQQGTLPKHLAPPMNACADVRDLTTPRTPRSRSIWASPLPPGAEQGNGSTNAIAGIAGSAAPPGKEPMRMPSFNDRSPTPFGEALRQTRPEDSGSVQGASLHVPAAHPDQQVQSLPSGAVAYHVPIPTLQPRVRMYLGSDTLGLMIAPGDVLVVRGSGGLGRIGAAGGFMGHVMVVVAPPRSVLRSSPDAAQVVEAWPDADVPELWRVPTVESTSREVGLWEAEMVLFIDRRTRQLKIAGEIDAKGDLCLAEVETVELWQSPEPLRSDLRVDLMHEVLSDMRLTQANWSATTAARAVLRSAAWTLDKDRDPLQTMSQVMASWESKPICTSVAISFWQRYLHRVAAARASAGATHFSAGERVFYFSQSMKDWVDAVVVNAHRDAAGAVVCYDLDIKQGALPENIRRTVSLVPFGRAASDAYAVELILSYMPIQADRGLPGDLTKAMADCGWVAVTQVPFVFSQEVLQVPTFPAAIIPGPERPE